MTKTNSPIRNLILSALFLALCLVLPFITGQIPTVGSMLLPMHIPVLLCGYVCGGVWGLIVGFVAPIMRSMLFSMPPMFPTAISMAFELAAYGLFSGLLYKIFRNRKLGVFMSLIPSMVLGRVVWGIVRYVLTFLTESSFSWALFLSGAVTTAIPGIVLQIILIPLLVYALEKANLINRS